MSLRWTSTPALFYQQAARWQSRPLVFGKRDHHWRPLTWSQVALRAQSIAAGLISLGSMPQQRVAIWAMSSPEWVLCDLGALSAGLVSVPIYEGCSDEELLYILRDCECTGIFIQGEERLSRLLALASLSPELKWIITLDDREASEVNPPQDPPSITSSFLLSRFKEMDTPSLSPETPAEEGSRDELLNDHPPPRTLTLSALEALYPGSSVEVDERVTARIEALQLDDLMTLQYTSGTTGEPKGVMMTHRNILTNCKGAIEAVPVGPADVLLSFLPLSHSFERMAGYYMPTLFGGAQIYFAEGLGRLIRNMYEVSPTIVTGVPRIYEKIYARFRGRGGAQGMMQRTLTQWALKNVKSANRSIRKGRSPKPLVQRQIDFAQQHLFKELRARLGGRLRFMVSGGAPLAIDVAEFFHAAGLLILEGYGLSETAPVLSVNRPQSFRFGSVGRPLYNVHVRCAEDGEILVQGDNLTQGYINKHEESLSLYTEDGWLKTGDLGHFDEDGFLYITDRKKDLFKTASGKLIAPQYLERVLNSSPVIEQSYIFGDRSPYCVALIVPSAQELTLWATHEGIDLPNGGLKVWVTLPQVYTLISQEVGRLNRKLARHETIKRFHLCGETFEGLQLTTYSLKLKRRAVMEAYAHEISGLYQTHF